jgi:hypothetical protein
VVRRSDVFSVFGSVAPHKGGQQAHKGDSAQGVRFRDWRQFVAQLDATHAAVCGRGGRRTTRSSRAGPDSSDHEGAHLVAGPLVVSSSRQQLGTRSSTHGVPFNGPDVAPLL